MIGLMKKLIFELWKSYARIANGCFKVGGCKKLMLQMIQEMDLDIVDFRVEEKENDRIEVFTKHIIDEYEAELNLFDESSGTKKLFGLLPFIAKSLLKGTTLVIDELDAKIHPVLLKYLIMTFSDMEKIKRVRS